MGGTEESMTERREKREGKSMKEKRIEKRRDVWEKRASCTNADNKRRRGRYQTVKNDEI